MGLRVTVNSPPARVPVPVPARVQQILLDIEGTTSSIRFVTDVMFPYAREHLRRYLQRAWGTDELQAALGELARDLGKSSSSEWLGTHPEPGEAQNAIVDAVHQLMDRDAKVTGLKELQGLIWRDGFEEGKLIAHLYPDVVPALKSWLGTGRRIWIYSSGSVGAQKLFFGHSVFGNLLPYFSGHFDTTLGGKKDVESYRRILGRIGCSGPDLLFISDVASELQAARQAGCEVLLSNRPENPPQDGSDVLPAIQDFSQIVWE